VVIISHRGNLNGPLSDLENRPEQIDIAIQSHFDVEIDLWAVDGNFFLGHDYPQYSINIDWLNVRSERIWAHCKNFQSFSYLVAKKNNLNFFFHQNDDYTLTSKNNIWVFPNKPYDENSIIVSTSEDDFHHYAVNKPYGVCTNFPTKLVNFIK
jgi:hypothetical protein